MQATCTAQSTKGPTHDCGLGKPCKAILNLASSFPVLSRAKILAMRLGHGICNSLARLYKSRKLFTPFKNTLSNCNTCPVLSDVRTPSFPIKD